MKKYPFSHSFRKADIVLTAVTVVLAIAFSHLMQPFDGIFKKETDLSQGYIARESGGLYYTLDNGHSRLICLDRTGKIRFVISDPSDNGESVFYIDDMYIAPDALYLSASVWDGMLLDREAILEYTPDGQFVRTAADLDYTLEEAYTNKHRIYGVCVSNGVLTWAECREDRIILHRGEETSSIHYPDAFNAVSDLVFDGTDAVILRKNGTVSRFRPDGSSELLYSTSWPGERDRIPFRIALRGSRLIFTDIRFRQVLEADPANKTCVVLRDGTDSQTVTFSEDGTGLLLMEPDGLLAAGKTETRYGSLLRSDAQVTRQWIFLGVTALLAVSCLLLLIRLGIVLKIIMHGHFQGASLMVVLVVLLVGVVISTMLLNSFRDEYLGKIKEQLQTTAYIVASNVTERQLDGVRRAEDFGGEAYNGLVGLMTQAFPLNIDFCRTAYCNLLRMDDERENGWGLAYLDQSIGVYFPLDDIETLEARLVYDTAAPVWDDAVADVTGTYLSVKVPILNPGGDVIGVVAVGADTFVVDDMVTGMQHQVLLSIVVIVLLIWVVFSEGISFVANRNTWLADRKVLGDRALPGHLLRLLVFAVFAAFNLVSSFLPVFILNSSDIFPEGGRELAASLPMTVNIFMIGLMSLFCAGAVRRMGIRNVFAFSLCFSIAGNLLLLLVPGYAAIMAGLVLDGIGVGMITNAVYVLLTYIRDEKSRADGLSICNTASLAGINFGMIIGSVLAVRIGQRYVFLAVAALWAALLVFSALLVRRLGSVLKAPESEQRRERIRAGGFLRNRTIWSFILLIQNPYILFSSFVFFFVPIFCESLGYNETVTAAFLMLYSETAVLLGEGLSEHMDRTMGGRSMYMALGLNVAGILLFAVNRNLYGLVLALLLMGVSAAFGKPCQQTYYLRQAPTVSFGEDRAMGVYNFSENIGESLGPVVWGAILAGGGAVIYYFLAAVSALGGLHYTLNKRSMQNDKAHEDKGTETV